MGNLCLGGKTRRKNYREEKIWGKDGAKPNFILTPILHFSSNKIFRILCYVFCVKQQFCNFLKVAIEDYHQAVAASFMKWIPISALAAAGVNLPAESKVVSSAVAAPGKHRKSSKVRLQAA